MREEEDIRLRMCSKLVSSKWYVLTKTYIQVASMLLQLNFVVGRSECLCLVLAWNKPYMGVI